MRATGVILGLVAASLACASEPTGSAMPDGSSDGPPGVDSGASSDALPACPASLAPNRAAATLLGPDGKPVTMGTNAGVTVTASESCAAVTCPSSFDEMATRIALTAAGGGQWSLYLRYDLPAGLLQVGDRLDLTVDARPARNSFEGLSQTIVLSREGRLVLFAARLSRIGVSVPPLPELDAAFGIQLSDDGPTCHADSSCSYRSHAVRVTVGGDSAIVAGGQTARIGWLSFTSGHVVRYVNTGGCDQPSDTAMAGHRAP
jgi:hypothetical protein